MAQLNPEQWSEVERLFELAEALPVQDRAAFLARERPGPAILAELTSLLSHASGAVPSVSAAIAAAAAALACAPNPDLRLIGARLGPYKVEAIAGHGGMGAVYRASRDDAEFHQQVAIKLVRVAAESQRTLQRFRQERQILARLSHPNIARLLDGGSTPEGVPYLVMEFIEGPPITVWCDRHSLGIEQRLRLFLRVCEAVQFAHRDLVVHRDLKPDNILVTKDGTPKLLDFGIAKLLDPVADNESATVTNQLAMTPDYASPELVSGEPISTAADVYALGLILYELLTGRKAQIVGDLTPASIVRVVCQTEPTAPATLKPELSGDLDNIIRMAIRKEPERRYRSAADLSRDIQLHLEGRPVIARPDTFGYRGTKFLRRNRVAVGAGALVALSLCAGLLVSLTAGRQAEKHLPRVLQVTQLTQAGRADFDSGVATDGSNVYFSERMGGRWSLARVSVQGGTALPLPVSPPLDSPDIQDISSDRSKLLVASGLDDRPLWLLPIAGGAPRLLLDRAGRAAVWSRDGSKIVIARDTALYQVGAADGTGLRKLVDVGGEADDPRCAPAPLPNVLRFTLFSLAKPSTLWESAADGSGLHPFLKEWRSGASSSGGEGSGRWMPNGKYYVFKSQDRGVASIFARRDDRGFLRGSDNPPVKIYSTPSRIGSLAPDPSGARIFFTGGQERRELVRYNPRLSQFLPYLSGVAAQWVGFSRDGQWVAYTTAAEAALWRSRADGSERLQLTPRLLLSGMPRWSPDGSRIAFVGAVQGELGTLYVIPSAGGAPQPIAPSDGEPSWSTDGNSLMFSSKSNSDGLPPGLRVRQLTTGKTTWIPGSGQIIRSAWSFDSRYIAANREGVELLLFDFTTQRWTSLVTGQGLGIPIWSADSKYVYYQAVIGGAEQPVFRVRIANGKTERMVDSSQIPQSNVTAYLFSGLAPGDTPVANLIRTNSDIYALDIDLP